MVLLSFDGALWREDVDALQFAAGHGGNCLVHRLAFRSLLGCAPHPADCMAFFAAHACAFREAARAKIAYDRVCPGVNFHLTSRDAARLLARHGLEVPEREVGPCVS